jgi:BirA family biotin operon repressor/biotin-[acetyl-CoA-carboxylase] ligase
LFNLEEFDIKLDTNIIGRNFLYFEECESTNDFLMKTTEYTRDGTVVLSEYQSKGKGRKDRSWLSSKGQNLTFSILLNHKISPKLINIINLGAALSVAHSLENLYQLDVDLKWPNDVLVNRKKIAGILLNSSSIGSSIEKVVLGIGVNVNQVNFQGQYLIQPTSVKKEFHDAVKRERLLSELLNNFEETFNICLDSPKEILESWKEKCKMLGEKVTIIEGDKEMYGIFENIDNEGYLILKRGTKTERVHHGDVSLRY